MPQDLNNYSVRPKAIRYLLGYLVQFLGKLLAKIEVLGRENIPPKGPFIIASNHFSRLDPPFVIYAIKQPICFLMASDQTVEPQLMWGPWLYGFIPTNRDSLAPSTIKRAVGAIKKGEVIGIFPEGSATEQHIRPAKNGAAYLAMTTNARIVPMSIIGMDNIWENWFKGIRPKLTITIGKSFVPPKLPTDRNERNLVLKDTGEDIMCRISALLPPKHHGVYTGDPRINNYRLSENPENK